MTRPHTQKKVFLIYTFCALKEKNMILRGLGYFQVVYGRGILFLLSRLNKLPFADPLEAKYDPLMIVRVSFPNATQTLHNKTNLPAPYVFLEPHTFN